MFQMSSDVPRNRRSTSETLRIQLAVFSRRFPHRHVNMVDLVINTYSSVGVCVRVCVSQLLLTVPRQTPTC